MTFDPKSIADQIECLARLTGAPESFVGQVRSLFSTKGISLDEDATPYLKALEDAFRREENIRANAQRARENVDLLRERFSKIGAAYAENFSKLQLGGKQRARKLRDKLTKTGESGSTTVIVPDGHRSYVMPHQKDVMPMVPGPEEPQ